MPKTEKQKNWLSFQEFLGAWIKEHGAQEAVDQAGKEPFLFKWLGLAYKGARVLARMGLSPNQVSYLAIITSFLSAFFILLAGWMLAPITPSLLVTAQLVESGAPWFAMFLPPMGFLPPVGYDAFKPQILIATLCLFFAFALFLLSGLLDQLDGAVARLTQSQSQWGSVFDQVLDKYADAAVVGALILARFIDVFWGLATFFAFVMVDYARARHQADGLHQVKVTRGERPYRILLFSTAAGLQILSYLAIVFDVEIFIAIPIMPFFIHQLTMEALRYFNFLLMIICTVSVIQMVAHAKKHLSGVRGGPP